MGDAWFKCHVIVMIVFRIRFVAVETLPLLGSWHNEGSSRHTDRAVFVEFDWGFCLNLIVSLKVNHFVTQL